MTNSSKHLLYYIVLLGCLVFSVGYNVIQNEEVRLLKLEKDMYKVFFEYLYLKLENIEKGKDFVYKL